MSLFVDAIMDPIDSALEEIEPEERDDAITEIVHALLSRRTDTRFCVCGRPTIKWVDLFGIDPTYTDDPAYTDLRKPATDGPAEQSPPESQ